MSAWMQDYWTWDRFLYQLTDCPVFWLWRESPIESISSSLTFLVDIHMFFFKNLFLKLKYLYYGNSLVVQSVKNLPAVQETWVQSLGQEDPLEKEVAIRSSILAWEIPGTEEPGRLQSMGLRWVGHN